jgi:hypothetical protein
LAITILLCLVGVGALFILADASAASPGLPRRVANDGQDNADCTSTAPPFRTVQYAIDVAGDNDVIKVATGVDTGVNGFGGLAQVVYLSRTLTVRGGYTTTNWTTSDPVANPTTLDAEGQGRVLDITGLISPTIEGLRMTGGDATGWGGGGGLDVGGGGSSPRLRLPSATAWCTATQPVPLEMAGEAACTSIIAPRRSAVVPSPGIWPPQLALAAAAGYTSTSPMTQR